MDDCSKAPDADTLHRVHRHKDVSWALARLLTVTVSVLRKPLTAPVPYLMEKGVPFFT